MLATMVGSANGRSMSALTYLLPGKSSRTSTHAMSVPMTALSRATPTDTRSVVQMAAGATGAVTASQKPASPSSSEWTVSAASGSRTITLSHSPTTPTPRARPRARPGRPPSRVGGVPARATGGEEVSTRSSRGRVVVVMAPTGSPRRRSSRCRRREQVVVERLGLRCVGALGDDGRRVLDLERLRRRDVLDRVALALDEQRLVLVAQQRVAGALEEGLRGLATGLGLDLHVVLDQRVDVGEPGGLVLAPVALGGVGGEQVPLRRARAERVGGDHLDAGLEQVVPVLDALGVALADDDRDDRSERNSLVRVVVPLRVDEAGVDEACHVGLDGEVDEVRLGAGSDLAALVARG